MTVYQKIMDPTRENCRDQKIKYRKNIFKTELRFICIFLTLKIVLHVSTNIRNQLKAKKMQI